MSGDNGCGTAPLRELPVPASLGHGVAQTREERVPSRDCSGDMYPGGVNECEHGFIVGLAGSLRILPRCAGSAGRADRLIRAANVLICAYEFEKNSSQFHKCDIKTAGTRKAPSAGHENQPISAAFLIRQNCRNTRGSPRPGPTCGTAVTPVGRSAAMARRALQERDQECQRKDFVTGLLDVIEPKWKLWLP